MKTKHLAMENGDLTGSSIGDQMSSIAESEWLEAELLSVMSDYMRANDFKSGYSFIKNIEGVALTLWRKEIMNRLKQGLDPNGLPF
tara:strand:- start:337 stop:594 length:258 start_codon:yes stop_codon:yes gene_type:complete